MKLFPKTVDSQFLVRVIRNEVSPEEKEFFEAWLRESDEHKEEFGSFVLLWDKMGNARIPNAPNPASQFLSIRSTIACKESELANKKTYIQPESKQSEPELLSRETEDNEQITLWERFYPFLSWSAGLAATIVIVFAFHWMYRPAEEPRPVKSIAVSDLVQIERRTQKGERVTIPLEDGSIVYLNAFSRISYPKKFSKHERYIELEGEAYFTVAADKQRPFRVKCGNTVTEVVGTEFNIKYRSHKYSIVVAKGLVKSSEEKHNSYVMLARGQMTTYSASAGFSRPVKVNVAGYTAWLQNKLSFKRTPLKEVMNELEIFYNVKVTFKNKTIKEKTLSGVFEADSLDNILEIISLAMDVEIKRDGQTIIVN